MAAGAAYGSQIVTVTFLGVPGSPLTPPVDGNNLYVAPYQLTIDDGVNPPQLLLVTCYEESIGVTPTTWEANLFTIAEASTNGMFAPDLAGYEEVAWLSGLTYSGTEQQIALQHAIWDVFGPTPGNETVAQTNYRLAYQAAAAVAASNNYLGYETWMANARFIEMTNPQPNGGNNTPRQPFVFGVIIPNTGNSFGAPEPGTSVLIGGGLLCLLGSLGFKRFAAKRG